MFLLGKNIIFSRKHTQLAPRVKPIKEHKTNDSEIRKRIHVTHTHTPDNSHSIAQRIKCVLKKATAKEAAKQKKFINCERRCRHTQKKMNESLNCVMVHLIMRDFVRGEKKYTAFLDSISIKKKKTHFD